MPKRIAPEMCGAAALNCERIDWPIELGLHFLPFVGVVPCVGLIIHVAGEFFVCWVSLWRRSSKIRLLNRVHPESGLRNHIRPASGNACANSDVSRASRESSLCLKPNLSEVEQPGPS
jgi:hypothetical protein